MVASTRLTFEQIQQVIKGEKMKPRRFPLMTLMVALLFAMTGLLVGLAGAQPVPGAKVQRPAAAASSPEETLQRQLPPPTKPEALRAPIQADMEGACNQNPRCRAKLEQSKQVKRPAVILPAATEPSPEEQLQKSLPPPAQGLPPMGPRSHLLGPVEGFFTWINPFTPDPAWAQAALNLTFTPSNRFSANPWGQLIAQGVFTWGNAPYFGLKNQGYSLPAPYAENKPYMYLAVHLPAAGYYLIDIMASPSLIKLRHQSNGPILETWDYQQGCGGVGECHYVTVDYYAAGPQYWYFWADPTTWGTYFYSVTIKSYP